jgi:hypothetical protein
MPGRDFDARGYSPDEERVAEWFFEKGVGGGDDPIGAMIASHEALALERNELKSRKVVAWRIAPHDTLFLVGGTITDEERVAKLWKEAGCVVEELCLLNKPSHPLSGSAPGGDADDGTHG